MSARKNVAPKKPPAKRKSPPKKPQGRPTRCDPATTKRICTHIAVGIAFKPACEAEGVSESTGHEWMVKGAEGIDPYALFSGAVTRARALGEIALHNQARAGGKGSSTATWLLERRFRDNYGKIERLEHSGPAGKPIEQNVNIDFGTLSDDELRRIAEGGDGG